MRATNRIESDINAGPVRGQLAYGRHEVTRAIVDPCCPEPINHRQVCRGTRANRFQAEVACEIKQRRTDGARSANDENRGAGTYIAATSQQLKGSEVSKRDANRLGRIDAIGDWHEQARRADRILRVAAHDTQIGDNLALKSSNYAAANFLDDA